MAATPPCSPATAAGKGAFTKRESVEDAAALERTAAQLESEGQDLASIRNMERALLLRCRDGAIDASCLAAAERLVVKCNTVAVKAFKADDYGTACLLLDNALRLTDGDSEPLRVFDDSRQRLRGTTLNNYGCLERRRGHLQASLQLLTMSLDYAGQQSPATYLNMSAIQSQIGLHEEAVGHARRAIGLLEHMSDSTGMLAIAQHNLATALESLNPTASAAAYEKALQIAKSAFGMNSPTTQSILKNLQRFHQRAKTVKPLTLPPIGNTSSNLSADKRRPLSPVAHPFAVSKRTTSGDNVGDSIESAPPHSRSGGRKFGSPRREQTAFSASPVPPSTSRPQTTEGTGQRPPMNSSLKPKPPTAERAATSTGGPRSRRSSDNTPTASAQQQSSKPLRPIRGRLTDDPKKSTSSKGATSTAEEGLTVAIGSTPREGDLPTPKRTQQPGGAATPKEGGKALLTPTTSGTVAAAKASGTPTAAGAAAASASEFAEVQPTLPNKPEDLAAFMLSRLGVLLAAEDKFETMYRHVVRIQSMYRCFSSRRQLSRRRDERRRQHALHIITLHSASKRIQRFLRSAVKRRLLLQHIAAARNLDSERKSASAIVIQKTARRWLARRIVRAKRTLKRSSARAVIRLQTWFRKVLAVRHGKYLASVARSAQAAMLLNQRRWQAANRIQSSWRASVARGATRELRGEAFVAREQLRKSKMVLSAIRIQSLQRGLVARKAFAAKDAWRMLLNEKRRAVERRRFAAAILQGFGRGIISRRITDPMLEAQRVRATERQVAQRIASTTRLQSWARMLAARRLLFVLKQQRHSRIEGKRLSWLVGFVQRCGRAYSTRAALNVERLNAKRLPTSAEWSVQQKRKENQRLLLGGETMMAPSLQQPSATELLTASPEDAAAAPAAGSSIAAGSACSEQAIAEAAAPTPPSEATETNLPLPHSDGAAAAQPDAEGTVEEQEASAPPSAAVASDPPVEGDECTGTPHAANAAVEESTAPPSPPQTRALSEPVEAAEVAQEAEAPGKRVATPPELVQQVAEQAAATGAQQQHEQEELSAAAGSATHDAEVPAASNAATTSSSTSVALEKDVASSEPEVVPHAQQQQQPIPAQEYPVSFVPRPPPRRAAYSEAQKRAGATIVRVARGCLSRRYSTCVRGIVGEYIDSLVARHCPSPTRPLAYDVLHRMATDSDVVNEKKRLVHKQEAEEMLAKKHRAAYVLQRNVRVLLAKCKLLRLREERNLRWEERRQDEDEGEAPIAETQEEPSALPPSSEAPTA